MKLKSPRLARALLRWMPYTIVGVMHPDWRFGGRDLAIFTPRTFSPTQLQQRGAHFVGVIGRLKPAISIESARAEMTTIASRLEAQYPDTNNGWGVVARPLLEAAVGDFRPVLAILLGAVGPVLLVACANLATMHALGCKGRPVSCRCRRGPS